MCSSRPRFQGEYIVRTLGTLQFYRDQAESNHFLQELSRRPEGQIKRQSIIRTDCQILFSTGSLAVWRMSQIEKGQKIYYYNF